MNNIQADGFESDFFKAKVHDQVCTVELINCSMLTSTDLRCRNEMVQLLDHIANIRTIKVMIMMSHHSASCCEDYVAFYDRVYQSKIKEGDLLRACRSLDQVMLKIVGSPKFIIGVNSGKLFPEAFSWDLACDYRIISNDTTFQNACLDYDLVPKGGVVYFLEKCIGHSAAVKWLLRDVPLRSDQALSMGLVDRVVPGHKLEAVALETAQYYAQQPAATIAGIKKMQNYIYQDLGKYLEFETQALARLLRVSLPSSYSLA